MTDEERTRKIFQHSMGDIEINLGYKRSQLLKTDIAEALRAERQRTLESEVVKELFESGIEIEDVLEAPPNLGIHSKIIIDNAIDRFRKALIAFDATLKVHI